MSNRFDFVDTFSYKLIYIFKIDDELHNGILKIGEATLNTYKTVEELSDNCAELNDSASNRIRQYTNTIGVQEDLLYTTLAISNKNKTFKDKDVHRVLKNSGIVKHNFGNEKDPEEWYETNLETAKNAINAVKEGRKSLDRTEVDTIHEDIDFRPEQKKAIDFTLKRFEVTDNVLWNAKMRFGKTLSALEVIKRMSNDDSPESFKAIILTHRPVVDASWFEDYTKIFWNTEDFLYGSKNKSSIHDLLESKKNFIYFASMQDLRGSGHVGGIYNKNDAVFNTDWDLLIVDEAHEGTQTDLGQSVIKAILNSEIKTPKLLMLSGTPFNLLNDYESSDIYTWDYIMEQKAKLEWDENHPLEPNPYADLPKLNILTYNLEEYLPQYQEVADSAFNFKEFFRVWTGETERDGTELSDESLIGKFVHENDVSKFLELLTKQDEKSNYPFSKQEYRENFRHSFWILPGVKEAKALKDLLLQNPIFSQFNIVNVAGTGDDDGYEALDAVENAIGDNPEDTYTITLSCGKLTTGVTVKPWTAVLYLAGSYSTSASSYLQTIFRVQSPSGFNGKQKTNCYVFDFAPDRTLKMVAAAGDLSIKAGSTDSRERMTLFLNYCPVIAVNGSEMKPYNVNSMLQQLKKAYVERVVDNGFDDSRIYNDNLLQLSESELKLFSDLKGIVGESKQTKKIHEIDINSQGFTEEEWAVIKKAEKKQKKELTKEQKKLLEELKAKKKQRSNAISILRGISIRIPLLIYGADIEDSEDVTIDNFTNIVDDSSWNEFMPKGVTKEKFNEISKYYDNEIFIGAGRRIRNIVKYADTLSPIARALVIANLFSNFRNPDKETVLTPWKTVNRHMAETIGGYSFFDDKYIVSIEEPRFVNQGDVTKNILLNKDSHILEINSKTGLYPLYVTISLFKHKFLNTSEKKMNDELIQELWNQTVENNIFVVCRTPMACSITKRTLVGYKDTNTNIISIDSMVEDLNEEKYEEFEKTILNPKNWNKEGENMNFDAIIGNPPYQNSTGGGQAQGTPLYDKFVLSAIKLNPNYISMIMPSRWFAGGFSILDKFRNEFVKDNHLTKICDFPSALDCFSNVEIKGGVCFFLYDSNYSGECNFRTYKNNELVSEMDRFLIEDGCQTIIRDNNSIEILKKVMSKGYPSFSEIVSTLWPYSTNSSFSTFSHKKKKNNDYIAYIIKDKGWVSSSEITKNINIAKKWKLFLPRNVGRGDAKTDVLKPIVAEPNSVCSGTYIICGPFESETEAQNIKSYINTKFFHFLLSLKKVSQDNTNKCYEFIPKLDYNKKYDDNELYNLFDLSKEEIKYIESAVREDIGK